MARARSPNRDKAYEMWLKSGQIMLLKDIAAELNVSESQIRKWKNQDKWDADSKVTLPKTNSNVTKHKGAPQGNKNAVGNAGGSAPLKNKNAEKHGLFAKYLPADTLEIFDAIDDRNTIDMQWDMIKTQYAAILLAQKKRDDYDGFIQSQSRAMATLNSMIKQYEEMLNSDLATEEQKARIDKLKVDIAKSGKDENSNGQLEMLLEAVKAIE